jgi:hypothetical protein
MRLQSLHRSSSEFLGFEMGSQGFEHNIGRVPYKSMTRLHACAGVLEITDITPTVGSINGGTIVTITGRGFATEDSVFSTNIVSIGAFPAAPCRVISAAWDKIVCQTEPAGRMHVGAYLDKLLPVEIGVNGALIHLRHLMHVQLILILQFYS